MSIRKNSFPVVNLIRPRHILISVYYKDALEALINGILVVNPEAMFYSTGGTGKKVKEILGPNGARFNYISVEDFTFTSEMEGGLVKTLHPKIFSGLLSERGNPDHINYVSEAMKLFRPLGAGSGTPGVYFDAMIGGFYPFNEKIEEPGCTPEKARDNIDIGGPTMVEAAAKNWHSTAVLTSPAQYQNFLNSLAENKGKISAIKRYELAQKAMRVVADYRKANADYFEKISFIEAAAELEFIEEEKEAA